jgi:hypothetical protein
MMDESDGVLLTDKRSRIFLHPPQPDPHGHGFRQLVDIVAGSFRGTIEAECYDPRALHSFHQQLQELYQSLKGKAELPCSYENLKVSLEGDGMGHMTVRVEAREGFAMNVRLNFFFQIDQTELRAVIDSTERLLDQPGLRQAINSMERVLVKALPLEKEVVSANKKPRGFRRGAFAFLNIVKRKFRS